MYISNPIAMVSFHSTDFRKILQGKKNGLMAIAEYYQSRYTGFKFCSVKGFPCHSTYNFYHLFPTYKTGIKKRFINISGKKFKILEETY